MNFPARGQAKKTALGLCAVPFCRRPRRPGHRLCCTCADRKWRAKHPEHHLWNNLKKSAKRRGIDFCLTLDDWKKICRENDFVARVGRSAGSLTVNRIRSHEGYSIENIEPLTNSENAARGNRPPPAPYLPHEDPLAA